MSELYSLEAGTVAGFQAGFMAVIQPGFGLEILLRILQESGGRCGHEGGQQKYLTLSISSCKILSYTFYGDIKKNPKSDM